MNSPINGEPMIPVHVHDVTFYKDAKAQGYWVHVEALRALAEIQETELTTVHTGETLHEHRGRFCPEDNEPLYEFEFRNHSDIRLDICKKCGGIWLDQVELQRLMEYLSNHEFGAEIVPAIAKPVLEEHHDDDIGITDRVLLFLYSLTAHPPLY